MSGDGCPVRWCDNKLADHSGLHSRHLAVAVAKKPRVGTVAFTIESPNEQPWPVITVGDGTVVRVVLPWEAAVDIASAIFDAAERYAP